MIIQDTLSREEKVLSQNTVGIYLCGVTVYDDSHIGHARTIIVFDVLRRYLEHMGHAVRMIQNFTDVDDKIIQRAATEGAEPLELSARYINRYHQDFDALNVLRATAYPQASEHITQIISLISELIKSGHAYDASSGVYYSVGSFPQYGVLSKKDMTQMLAGSRVDLEHDKKDPADFALWKKTGEPPFWDSPWGTGRPGWHIECSAMSLQYLGKQFEIHGGGRDLIFPHHENEIAQNHGYSGLQPAHVWMHTGMVTISGQKMSKSLGNVKTVRTLLYMWGPNVLRLFCLSGQYQKPIDYTPELLTESLALWRRLETCYHTLEQTIPGDADGDEIWLDTFERRLSEDLNTHGAIATMMEMAREVGERAARKQLDGGIAASLHKQLQKMLGILGLVVAPIPDMANMMNMVKQREECRRARDYSSADSIRDKLRHANVELLDYRGRTLLVYHEPIPGENAV